ncbi:MAG: hypothetical protein AMJ60_11455 [Desulfobacterales bacterium SG8_35]|nr:MAG: hypothetical protein AMJ60_11455 [Desulfobacterales bacterium SG8_35]
MIIIFSKAADADTGFPFSNCNPTCFFLLPAIYYSNGPIGKYSLIYSMPIMIRPNKLPEPLPRPPIFSNHP